MAQAQTIARPYVKALSALGRDEKDQKQWLGFLQASASLIKEKGLQQIMRQQGFVAEFKQWLDAWLQKAHNRRIGVAENQFLDLLAEQDRLSVLPEIAQMYEEALNAKNGVVAAYVQTAQALEQAQQEQIKQAIARKTGAKVDLKIEQVPELMAGIIIEYNGQVIDQSLKGRLQSFGQQLDN